MTRGTPLLTFPAGLAEHSLYTMRMRFIHGNSSPRATFRYLVSGSAGLIFWKCEVGALRSSLPGTGARLCRSCSTFRIDRRGGTTKQWEPRTAVVVWPLATCSSRRNIDFPSNCARRNEQEARTWRACVVFRRSALPPRWNSCKGERNHRF